MQSLTARTVIVIDLPELPTLVGPRDDRVKVSSEDRLALAAVIALHQDELPVELTGRTEAAEAEQRLLMEVAD